MTAVAAVALIAAFQPVRARADTSVAGSQGTDTTLPATDSVFHAIGRGDFANLKITVNQTRNLTDQAISVSWTEGSPTGGGSSFLDNFLQIFQCWGNDDGTIVSSPGPPPEQCEFGYGSTMFNPQPLAGFAPTRYLSQPSFADYETLKSKGVGYLSPDQIIWMPFRSADGRTVNVNPQSQPEINPFFDPNTSNEIDFAHTGGDRTGQALFQAYTGKEAPGLGCGSSVDQPDGSAVSPKCWLVIVPRGGAFQENAGLAPNYGPEVTTSPLAPDAWANRIAVPLDFNSVDASCPSGAAQRIIAGSEVSSVAANNWKPVLCSQAGSPPYVYQSVGDPIARQQLLTGTASMAVTPQPLDPTLVDPATPVVYAPITISGLVIGFNVERRTSIYASNSEARLETPLNGTRVAHFNLTPRLVAKLLTESYRSQFPNFAVGNLQPVPGQEWLQQNPVDISFDRDFIQYNPEFKDLTVGNSATFAVPIVESRISDGTQQLWQWVLADPEARAWLAGGADNNSPPMNVNPNYSTNPKVNPTGAFGDPVPNTFPKNDPYCYQAPTMVGTPPQPVPRLCLPDVSPYALDLLGAAQKTRTANNGAKIGTSPATDPSLFYVSAGPQFLGSRAMMAVTDTSAAARFGLQVASLSRAGDDGTNRAFVAPDQAGLLAGEKAMVPNPAVPNVLQAAPLAAAPGAYPLTVLTYAATMPASLDATARKDYARFVSYAAGDGQTIGFGFGKLLPGYAPLPSDLRAQANAAAASILSGGPTPTPTPTSTLAPKHGSTGGETGTASQPGGNSATPTTAAGAPPSVALPFTNPAPQSSGPVSRTLAAAVGAIRFAVPITFALGVAAAAAWLLDSQRRKRSGGKHPPAGHGA